MGLWAMKGPTSGVWNLPFCPVSQESAAYHEDGGFPCNVGSNNDGCVGHCYQQYSFGWSCRMSSRIVKYVRPEIAKFLISPFGQLLLHE